MLQLAEVMVSRDMFDDMLERIGRPRLSERAGLAPFHLGNIGL